MWYDGLGNWVLKEPYKGGGVHSESSRASKGACACDQQTALSQKIASTLARLFYLVLQLWEPCLFPRVRRVK